MTRRKQMLGSHFIIISTGRTCRPGEKTLLTLMAHHRSFFFRFVFFKSSRVSESSCVSRLRTGAKPAVASSRPDVLSLPALHGKRDELRLPCRINVRQEAATISRANPIKRRGHSLCFGACCTGFMTQACTGQVQTPLADVKCYCLNH